jgi:hypothetical protein
MTSLLMMKKGRAEYFDDSEFSQGASPGFYESPI